MGFSNVIEKAVSLGLVVSTLLSSGVECSVLRTRATPSAVTKEGTVSGFTDSSGNSVYLGIPYAATTGGNNR